MALASEPMYPKISSIYNKIMQLAIAIIFIILLMNLWLNNVRKDEYVVSQHLSVIGEQYLQQAATSVNQLLQAKSKTALNNYLTELASQPLIKSIQIYDATGQLIAESGASQTVLSLYGQQAQLDKASAEYSHKAFRPFVMSLTPATTSGFIRVDVEKAYITQSLAEENSNQQQLTRIMLLMAGCAGFFLTRGLSRFSRQGYRINKTS